MDSRLQRRSGRHRLLAALAVIAIVACLGSVGTALATSGGDQQPAAVAATVLSLDGHEYPAVVARVNGEVIAGKLLAQRVYGIEHDSAALQSVTNPVLAALDGLVQDTVLRQAATAQGVTVTDAEIQAFQKSQQQIFAHAGPEATKVLQVHAEYQGDKSIAEYWADPRTIAIEREAILVGKMRQQIIQQLPPGQRNNPAAQQAIAQFVAAQHAQVETYIHP